VSGSTQTARVFVALPVSASLIEALTRLQAELAAAAPPRTVRWVRRDQLHLTLKFFGNVPTDRIADLTAALRAGIAGSTALALNVSGIGAFPEGRHPRVVWAGIAGQTDLLLALQQRIETATRGFSEASDTRPFQPHLTLGRVTALGRQAAEVGAGLAQREIGLVGDWPATELRLIRSQLAATGATYSDLAVFPLTPAAPCFNPRAILI
jgi:2'-5' RNA ligase